MFSQHGELAIMIPIGILSLATSLIGKTTMAYSGGFFHHCVFTRLDKGPSNQDFELFQLELVQRKKKTPWLNPLRVRALGNPVRLVGVKSNPMVSTSLLVLSSDFALTVTRKIN